MITRIELKNIRFYAFHGLAPQERKVGNNYVVNICIAADLTEALREDDYKRTIDYAKVYELTAEEMKIPSQLLEHLCGRIAASIKTAFPSIREMEVSVSKLNPPIEGADVEAATVRVLEKYEA